MPGHRHLLPEFLQQPLAVGLSLSLLPPAAACWSSRGVMTASTLQYTLPVYFVQSKRPGAHRGPHPRLWLPPPQPLYLPSRSSGAPPALPPERPPPNCSLCLECSPCPRFLQSALASSKDFAQQLPWTVVSKLYHLGSVFGPLKCYCFSSFKKYLKF